MRQNIRRWWVAGLIVLAGISPAHAQLFESDSKRYGNPKMDIVIREIERRPRSSVLDIRIIAVGSSVGSSFFLLCSVRQLAQLRGNYRYVVKLEERPRRGQMLIGFLRDSGEKVSNAGPEFAEGDPRATVIDLDQFAGICDLTK